MIPPLDLASQPVRNLVKNPAVAVGVTGYTFSTAGAGPTTGRLLAPTRVTSGGPFGGMFARMSWTASYSAVNGNDLFTLGAVDAANGWVGPATTIGAATRVYPGHTYALSVYARSSKDVVVRIGAQFITGAASASGTSGGADVTLPANVWTRLSGVATAGANADSLRLDIDVGTPGITWNAGDTFDVTCAAITETKTVLPYADGDTPGWAWTGTAGTTESVGYPYTLESIAGPLLASFGAVANPGGVLDSAVWDPVGRGVMALTVVDLLATPGAGVNDNILIYGTPDDTPTNSQLTQRLITTDGVSAILQTRRTGGASPAGVNLGSTPSRFVLGSGVVPGGKSFSAATTGEMHIDTTVSVAALTHSYIRWYPASAYHTPVAAVLLPGYNVPTLWRAMGWLARQYGATPPPGY